MSDGPKRASGVRREGELFRAIYFQLLSVHAERNWRTHVATALAPDRQIDNLVDGLLRRVSEVARQNQVPPSRILLDPRGHAACYRGACLVLETLPSA